MNPNRAFVDRVLGAVDSGDFPAFFAALDPDARFVFGSAPPAHGHDAIGALIGGVMAEVTGTQHHVERTWTADNAIFIVGRCDYTFKDGSTQDIAFCDVWRMAGSESIASYEVYCDLKL